jgi:hypothetical protein
MKVFIYILAASKDPEMVKCVVPYRINCDTIFFGCCKKRLRERLFELYLKAVPSGEIDLNDDIYIIGLNASNALNIRKIVWVGKIKKLYTFEQAFHIFSPKEEFKKMLDHRYSPLNLKPIYQDKKFIGYALRSEEHKEGGEWINDIANKENLKDLSIVDYKLILCEPDKRKDILIRDCCFTCENIFFADGKGLEIDDGLLKIFVEAQPERNGIDKYAIFGRNKAGKVDGRTGSYLEVDGEIANSLLDLVIKKCEYLKA